MKTLRKPTPAKPRSKSKTLKFNWVGTLVTIAVTVQAFVPDWGLSTQHTSWALTAVALIITFGNKELRKVTTGPVL